MKIIIWNGEIDIIFGGYGIGYYNHILTILTPTQSLVVRDMKRRTDSEADPDSDFRNTSVQFGRFRFRRGWKSNV